jgi:hypothetical protein
MAQETGQLDGEGAHRWESMALEQYVAGMAYLISLVLHSVYPGKSGEAKKLFKNRCAWA